MLRETALQLEVKSLKEELQAGKLKLQSQQARVQHLEDELGVEVHPKKLYFFPGQFPIGSQYILGYSLSSAHSTIIFKNPPFGPPHFINAPLLNSAGEEYQRGRGSVTGSPLFQSGVVGKAIHHVGVVCSWCV
ncbi:hypothetical protein CDAR_429811 [Caerostris darwini]|uniref:Uncharacterized protein n=1 Tax=Caerostris darwini TaxID=1538125 RepID=A0AAV4VV79_9ARAC|nr:hypothetical protein CDAR_429811 [Caerostris darwini]